MIVAFSLTICVYVIARRDVGRQKDLEQRGERQEMCHWGFLNPSESICVKQNKKRARLELYRCFISFPVPFWREKKGMKCNSVQLFYLSLSPSEGT